MENNELEEKRLRIIRGLEEAYKRLIEFKKLKNSPVIVSLDGQILELDPNKIPPTTMYKWH